MLVMVRNEAAPCIAIVDLTGGLHALDLARTAWPSRIRTFSAYLVIGRGCSATSCSRCQSLDDDLDIERVLQCQRIPPQD